jgi:hypothetical protein
MKLAKYSNEKIAGVALRNFLQRALSGGLIKELRVHVAGMLSPSNAKNVSSMTPTIIEVKHTPPLSTMPPITWDVRMQPELCHPNQILMRYPLSEQYYWRH